MKNIKQVIVVRKDLNMRKGKLAAQVAHASMKFIVDNNVSSKSDTLIVKLDPDQTLWLFGGQFTKIVLGCNDEDELRALIVKAETMRLCVCSIIDSGKTEFKGVPTLTCASFGPALSEKIDDITGHLTLL